jgi:hypothetical protein
MAFCSSPRRFVLNQYPYPVDVVAVELYGAGPWVGLEFMIGCAVSGLMLMCHRVLIDLVTRAGTAMMSTRPMVRPWWCGHEVPQRVA